MAASLPDKHKVSLLAESDNDKFVTYPQAERFAVDKTENKFAGHQPYTMTAPTLCMRAVRYDGRAGGEEERGPRHQISEATVPPPLSCKWRCIAFCAIAKKCGVVARNATKLVHNYRDAANCCSGLQAA